MSRFIKSATEPRFSRHAPLGFGLSVLKQWPSEENWVTDVILCVMQIHSVLRRPAEPKSALRRGVSPRRSSYALSQGAGPGYLITSGIGVHSTAPVVARTTVDRRVIESGV